MDSTLHILFCCDDLKAEMFLHRHTILTRKACWSCKIEVPTATGKLIGASDYFPTGAEAVANAWSKLKSARKATAELTL